LIVTTEAIRRFEGDHFFLSNFSPSWIEIQGIRYRTLEHAFAAAKATDRAVRMRIAKLETPGEAKRAGRRVPLRCGWNEMRVDVMTWLLARKFADGSFLARRLVKTGDAELVEGNDWGDRFWGQVGGVGENWLGVLLMRRRAWLMSRTGAPVNVLRERERYMRDVP